MSCLALARVLFFVAGMAACCGASARADDFDAGLRLMKQQRYADAIPYFQRAVRVNANARSNFAECYYQTDRCADAARECSTLIDGLPAGKRDTGMNFVYFVRLAQMEHELSRYRAAIRYASEVVDTTTWPIKLTGFWHDAYKVRGFSHQELGEYRLAIADYTADLRYDGSDAALLGRGGSRAGRSVTSAARSPT